MDNTATISCSLTPELLERLDIFVESGIVQNRSEAIRRAVDNLLVRKGF